MKGTCCFTGGLQYSGAAAAAAAAASIGKTLLGQDRTSHDSSLQGGKVNMHTIPQDKHWAAH